MTPPDFYLIRLRQISTQAAIGIHAFERAARQTLLVSVVLLLDPPKSGGDRIATVTDYDFVREGVLRLTGEKHFDLQETLCGAVLDVCLAETGVLGAVVQTEKPDVYPDVAGVSCRLARFGRPELAGFPWWTIDV
jgi:dihydroneopterin aldolase